EFSGQGHGTHCAGIVAGAREPARGPRYGVAPAAEILSARVLGDDLGGRDGWVLDALDWAVLSGAHVASMSFAARRTAEAAGAFEDALQEAARKGTTVVAAA